MTGLGVGLRTRSWRVCGRRLGANEPHGVSHLFLLVDEATGLGNDGDVEYENEDRHETADEQFRDPRPDRPQRPAARRAHLQTQRRTDTFSCFYDVLLQHEFYIRRCLQPVASPGFGARGHRSRRRGE